MQGELSDANLDSVKWVLNDSGALTYTMSQDDPRINLPKLDQNEIQLRIDDQVMFQGINQKCRNTPHDAQFTCPGILDYFKGFYILHSSRYYPASSAAISIGNGYSIDAATLQNIINNINTPAAATALLRLQAAINSGRLDAQQLMDILNAHDISVTIQGPGEEQFDIAADLIRFKQDENPDTERYIYPSNYVPSGVLRFRKYMRNDHQQILDILKDFNDLADALGNPTGFDYDIVVSGDGRREWTPYYPRKGSLINAVTLEWGRNITDYTIDEDGSTVSNWTYMTGGSNGDIKFEANARDNVKAGKYGQWEAVVSDSEENDVGVLQEKAQKYNAKFGDPLIQPKVTAVETPDKILGVVGTGDQVMVRIQRGRINYAAVQRIVSIEWKPGPATITLEFEEPEKT